MAISGQGWRRFARSFEQDGTRIATPVGKVFLVAGCGNR
jgi:hypothetical protein